VGGVRTWSATWENFYRSHASAVAQGNVVRSMSASYGKSLYSTLRRNQTPYATTTKIYTIDNVGDLNRCANFHCNRLDMERPHAYVKYNDFVTFYLLIVFYFFLYFFSRNRVAVERSVAQTCMMAQTTRFGTRTCLFGGLVDVCMH
jgi:hypothetical protein